MPNYEVQDSSANNAARPLVGFVVLVIIVGLSFLISPMTVNFVTKTNLVLGASNIKLLPISFPSEWPPIGAQLVMTVAVSLVLFVIAMIIIFITIPGVRDDTTVNLDDIRKEVEARKKVK
jgi:hypothetical protein